MPRLLLDTHAFLWWLIDDPRLPARARERIGDPSAEVFVSGASIWEIEVRAARGQLDAPGVDWLAEVEKSGFRELSISAAHAREAARLPPLHRDPFDRLLVAQARLEGLTLVSSDDRLRAYSVTVL